MSTTATNNSIFTDFLKALGVPHTDFYSNQQFKSMTFKSLFGLVHLLKDYGIESEAYQLEDMSELAKITPPFLAQKKNGVFVIVDRQDSDPSGSITFEEFGEKKTQPASQFRETLNGVVLCAFPDSKSSEPDYRSHYMTSLVCRLSKYVLIIAALALVGWFVATRGIYQHVSTILLTIFDGVGLWLSYLLLQKSLGIHTSTSDRVCGVLEKGGCDVITTSSASKLFGVF